jgi:D-aminoacyl-tRNA deacylase
MLIQRVSSASVKVNGETISAIEEGFCVFLGITHQDSTADIDWLTSKLVKMRIFNDENGKMNLALKDINGQVLVISQFTLHAQTIRGNRPSFTEAAKPELALELYQTFLVQLSKKLGKPVRSGIFGADMDVHILNQGPVTLWLDSKNKE